MAGFVPATITPEPPAHLPYLGSWNDNAEIYASSMGQRVKMPASQLQGVFMPNPKDVRIMQLEAELEACRAAKA